MLPAAATTPLSTRHATLVHDAAPTRAPAAPAGLATLHYVVRAPREATRSFDIDVRTGDAAPLEVRGSWADAVRAAQARAAVQVRDGIHHVAIAPAQAVLDAGAGAWLVAPLVADHRGAVGPVFVDGDLFRRVGLAVWATRGGAGEPGAAALTAVVGATQLLDFRSHRQLAAAVPVATVLAEAVPTP